MVNFPPASYPGGDGGLNPAAHQPQEVIPQYFVEGNPGSNLELA